MKRILTLALFLLSTKALYGSEFDELDKAMFSSCETITQKAADAAQQVVQTVVFKEAPQVLVDAATAAAAYAGQEALKALQEETYRLLCQQNSRDQYSIILTTAALAGVCVAAWPTSDKQAEHPRQNSSPTNTPGSRSRVGQAVHVQGKIVPAVRKKYSCFEIYKGTRELALVGLAIGGLYSGYKYPAEVRDLLFLGLTPAMIALTCGEAPLFKRIPVASAAMAAVIGGGFYRLHQQGQAAQALMDCVPAVTGDQLKKLCAYVTQKGIKGAYNALTAQ